jgi:hypothetical protein
LLDSKSLFGESDSSAFLNDLIKDLACSFDGVTFSKFLLAKEYLLSPFSVLWASFVADFSALLARFYDLLARFSDLEIISSLVGLFFNLAYS